MTAFHVLPQRIRVESAILRGQRIEGRLGLGQLPRLRELVAEDSGAVDGLLQAGKDSRGAYQVRGRLTGRFALYCEHCNDCFEWPVEIEIDWRLVSSEAEEQRLLAECDPVLVEDDWLPLRQLVEDELLLAVPMMPRCGACGGAADDDGDA